MVYESGMEVGEDMEVETKPLESLQDLQELTGIEKEFRDAFGETRILYPPRYQLAVMYRYHDVMHRIEVQADQAGMSSWTINGTDEIPIAQWEKEL